MNRRELLESYKEYQKAAPSRWETIHADEDWFVELEKESGILRVDGYGNPKDLINILTGMLDNQENQ